MDPKEIFRDAQDLFVKGQIQESIDTFTRSIDAGHNTEIAFLSRGVAYLKTDQVEKALDDFSTAIDMNRKNFRAFFYRGIVYMKKEDYEKAIMDYDRTIEIKPDYGAAFFARGTAYAQIGNEFEATRNINTAITCSEKSIQGFSDHYGMFRTQIDKALALMTGEAEPPSTSLNTKIQAPDNK